MCADAIINYTPLKSVNPPFNLEMPEANADLALQNKFVLQYGGIVELNSPPNWDVSFKENQSTKRLWLHSMPFALWLAAAVQKTSNNKYIEKENELIISYLTWLSDKSVSQSIGWSDDHMVANRSYALTYLYFHRESSKLSPPAIDLIKSSLIEHALWLSRSEHYRENNHGTMMDRSLITIALLQITDVRVSSEWIVTAIKRMKGTLSTTFDDKGCCTENSPSYHLLNTSLFAQMHNFLENHGLSNLIPDLLDVVRKAQSVSPLFIRRNGNLPTVGDTELIPQMAVSKQDKENLGVDCFPDSGFFIYKGPLLHFTAKCGGRSFIHRHVDDTSITLHYDGDDIITDGGFYSYDTNIRITRYFRSYLAHSGIFTANSDKMRFINFEKATDIANISYYCNSNNICMIEMKSYHDKLSEVKRNITVNNQDSIFVHDIISSIEDVSWRQQFLISPDCSVAVKGSTSVVINARNSSWEISQQNISGVLMKIEDAYFSDRFMNSIKTKCIVFYGESKEKQLYTYIRKLPSA